MDADPDPEYDVPIAIVGELINSYAIVDLPGSVVAASGESPQFLRTDAECSSTWSIITP